MDSSNEPTNVLDSLLNKALEFYKGKFIKPLPIIGAYAPAKVTIIGDHVDYSKGLALSMAVPFYTVAVGAANDSYDINIFTHSISNNVILESSFPIPSVTPIVKSEDDKWVNIIKGAAAFFKGYILEGCNIVFVSNVPWSIGLGSSTSLASCAYSFFEGSTMEKTYNPKDKAIRIADGETAFSCAPFGILDALILNTAEEGCINLCDCSTLETTPLKFNSEEYAFLLIVTEEKRNRNSKRFRKRIEQCTKAAKVMGVESLRDATPAHIKAYKQELNDQEEIYMRARHVMGEIVRAEKASLAITDGDYRNLGILMNQSHVSLRYDFEVSTKLSDSIVDIILDVKGVLGCRMQGYGFGGTVITLVRRNTAEEVLQLIQKKITEPVKLYIVEPINGAEIASSRIFSLERKHVQMTVGITTLIEYASESFQSHFYSVPLTAAHAPGRVNVIGDHTESNLGLVLQMALPIGSAVVGRFNNENVINIYIERDYAGSETDFLSVSIPKIHTLQCTCGEWGDIIRGVLICFHGNVDRGFDAVIVSSIPPLVGLASYSSVVVAFYTFMELLYEYPEPEWKNKAVRCYDAEKLFTKRTPSIADYMTIIGSLPNYLTFIDCKYNTIEFIRFPHLHYSFILADSNLDRVKTGLQFAERSAECNALCVLLEVPSLRDTTTEALESKADTMTKGMLRRGHHIINEIARVYQAIRAAKQNDMTSLGILMLQSHDSLITDYEISCDAQEELVRIAMTNEGCVGAKMTGSDFSTCTLALVNRDRIEGVIQNIHEAYKGQVMLYHLDPRGGCGDVTKALKLIPSKRKPVVEKFEQPLSEDSIKSGDLRELSWEMFDFNNQWANWEEKEETLELEGERKKEDSTTESTVSLSVDRASKLSIPLLQLQEFEEYPYEGETVLEEQPSHDVTENSENEN